MASLWHSGVGSTQCPASGGHSRCFSLICCNTAFKWAACVHDLQSAGAKLHTNVKLWYPQVGQPAAGGTGTEHGPCSSAFSGGPGSVTASSPACRLVCCHSSGAGGCMSAGHGAESSCHRRAGSSGAPVAGPWQPAAGGPDRHAAARHVRQAGRPPRPSAAGALPDRNCCQCSCLSPFRVY